MSSASLIVSSSLLEYIQHPDIHLHEFIFKESSVKAIDEWFTHIETLYQLPQGTPIRVLVDTRQSGAPSLMQSFRKAQTLMKRYPQRPFIRYVFLGSEDQGLLSRILRTFIANLRDRSVTQYLYGSKRAEAIQWLNQA